MDSLVIDRFGGLNLPEDPEEVGFNQALDMSNVDIDRRGRLRTRNGYAHWTAAAASGAYREMLALDNGLILATKTVGGGDLAVALVDGAVVATDSIPLASSFVSADKGGTQYVYVGCGSNGIRRYDIAGTSFSDVGLSAIPAECLAVQTPDNRLVAAYQNRVRFSNAGDPETFNSDDWVDITPGDGESISGVATWLNYTFVFKQTKFAVFTGNSVDSVGGPVFNYRMVETGVGASRDTVHPHSLTSVAPEGVYFANDSGVYLTSGGPPTLVSKDLEPLLYDATPDEFTGINPIVPLNLTYFHRRLFLVVSDGAEPNELYVFDMDENKWLRWTLSVNSLRSFGGTLYMALTSPNHIVEFGGEEDNGSDITWNYSSGYSDLGSPERKVLREASVWGSGEVTLNFATDHGDLDTGEALTLGTSPEVIEVFSRTARQGRFFRFGLSGTGPMSVNRLIFYFRHPSASGSRS